MTMKTFISKRTEVHAMQFKDCKSILGELHESGQAIDPFLRQDTSPEHPCEDCHERMGDHGVMTGHPDAPDESFNVCPSDWIYELECEAEDGGTVKTLEILTDAEIKACFDEAEGVEAKSLTGFSEPVTQDEKPATDGTTLPTGSDAPAV